jgi:uncharacterized protein (TIRG00374 family)
LIAVSLNVPRLGLYIIKWKYVSEKQKFDLKLSYYIRIFMIALYYSVVTPLALGYHLRAYYLKVKSKESIWKCLANSLLDVEIAFITGSFLSLVGAIFIMYIAPGNLRIISLFPIFLALFIFNFSLFVIFIKKKRGKWLTSLFLKPFMPKEYKSGLDASINLLYKDMPLIRDMTLPFIFDIIAWLIAGLQVYIISLSFDLNINVYLFGISVAFLVIIFSNIISVVFGTIIPTVGGLGVREGSFLFILGSFGAPESAVIAISLAGFITKMLVPSSVGFVLSLVHKDIEKEV